MYSILGTGSCSACWLTCSSHLLVSVCGSALTFSEAVPLVEAACLIFSNSCEVMDKVAFVGSDERSDRRLDSMETGLAEKSVDVARNRYPYSVVWTPLPFLT